MKELIAIQTEIKVAKNRKNKFADFQYRNLEDITEALKPFLLKHECFLVFTDEMKLIGDKHYIEATATITNKDGQSVSAKAYAREPESPKAKMDESQTTGSTSSYARKYAANGLFCLDDAEMDPDGQKPETPKSLQEQLSDMRIELENLVRTNNKWETQLIERYGLIKLSDMTETQVIEAYDGFKAKGFIK